MPIFFHPGIIGLTGNPEQIDDITRRYGTYYSVAADAGDDYEVDHSSQTILVGKNGEIIATLRHGTPSAEVLQQIREALKTG